MSNNTKSKEAKQYYVKNETESYEYNPFAQNLAMNIKLGKKITGYVASPVQVINNGTGEVLDTGTQIGVRKLVDREEFIKFFGAGILSTFDMPKSAQKVFQLIMGAYLAQNTASGDMDKIYFNYHVAADDWGYDKSEVTFNNGLNALINAGIFAKVKGRKGWLWINTSFMAKGDRVALYKEYIVEGSETHKQILAAEAERARHVNTQLIGRASVENFKLEAEVDGED
jgi:hypothetical protein